MFKLFTRCAIIPMFSCQPRFMAVIYTFSLRWPRSAVPALWLDDIGHVFWGTRREVLLCKRITWLHVSD